MESKYNLEFRTLKFTRDVINYTKSIKLSIYNKNSIEQILRSSSSVGANYREAIGGSSIKDFRNKIHICKKEAQETKYWLHLLNDCLKCEELIKECQELILIFNKITYTCNKQVSQNIEN